MCTTCGCGTGETTIEGVGHGHDPHWHVHADGTAHSHAPLSIAPPRAGRYRQVKAQDMALDPEPVQGDGLLHFGHGPAGAHAPGMTQSRMVQIERDILSKNDRFAASNRAALEARGFLALNLVSSPGSGKTSLLVRSIAALQGRVPVAVIEGDQQTSQDADRIRAAGAPALQINTGKGCHLDAAMVGKAIQALEIGEDGVLFIENVGNLVCPAAFDLGEAAKVVILSVTEGEDKPLKYPDMFRAARLMLLNKCDLLPYLSFDVERVIENARRVNPAIEVIRVSATSGEGMPEWLAWLERERADVLAGKQASTQLPDPRIAGTESGQAGVR